jgi:RNA polymerase sigma factor (sigma-70 family)
MLESCGPELHTLLVRLTLRVDVAEDLLQDLFVKLANSKVPFSVANSRAYIRRMAIHLAFDWRRGCIRDEKLAASFREGEGLDDVPAWMRLSRHEEIERILTLAAELPELQREAFVLRFVHDETHEQVAKALDRTPHQARALCHAAVHEIRRRLDQAELSGRVSLAGK